MPSPSDRISLRATHKSSRPSPLAPTRHQCAGLFWPNWGPLPCNQSHGERERGMDLLHPPMDLWVDKVWVLGDKIVSGFFLAIALGAIKSWSLQTCSSSGCFKEHSEKLKGLVCQLVWGISFCSICLWACQTLVPAADALFPFFPFYRKNLELTCQMLTGDDWRSVSETLPNSGR